MQRFRVFSALVNRYINNRRKTKIRGLLTTSEIKKKKKVLE